MREQHKHHAQWNDAGDRLRLYAGSIDGPVHGLVIPGDGVDQTPARWVCQQCDAAGENPSGYPDAWADFLDHERAAHPA